MIMAQPMEILLWRHAEAEERDKDDLERKLTDRGMNQARSVGHWLLDRRPEALRILVSPAIRTLQTAEALRLEYEISPQLSPSGTALDLIGAADWPSAGAVLLVGHQPALGRLAARLLIGTERDLTIPNGGLWWFTREERDGRSETMLKAAISASLAR